MSASFIFPENRIDLKAEYEREKADLEAVVASGGGTLSAAAARLSHVNDALRDLALCNIVITCRIPPDLREFVVRKCYHNHGLNLRGVDPTAPAGELSFKRFLAHYATQLKGEIASGTLSSADKASKKNKLTAVRRYQKFFDEMGDVTVWQEHVGVVDPVAFIDDYHQTVGEELKYKRKLRRLKKWGGIGLAATLAIAATGGTIFGVSKHHKAQQTKVVKQEQDNAVLNALMRSVVLTEVIHSIDSPQIASIDILRQLQAKKNRTGVEDIWLEVMQNATEEHAKLRKELNAQAKFPDSYKRLRSRRLKELEDERADKREFYSWSYGSRLKNHTALLLCQQEEALHQKYSKLTDEELKYMAEWEVLNIAGKYNPEERAIFLSKGPSGLNAAQKRGAPSGYTEVDWDR